MKKKKKETLVNGPDSTQFKDFLGVAVITYFLAYLLYLIAEAPTANLEKMLLGEAMHRVQKKTVGGQPSDEVRTVVDARIATPAEDQSKM